MKRLSSIAVLCLVVGACSSGSGGSSPTFTAVPATDPAGSEPTTTPTTTSPTGLPSVTDTAEAVAYLASHGVKCDRVDVENEGATESPVGAYARAMCYRTGAETLELLVYRSSADRDLKRPEMMSLPCDTSADLKALAGAVMTLAEGENFDVRAADSDDLTRDSLALLNAATEKAARVTGQRIGHASFTCATGS